MVYSAVLAGCGTDGRGVCPPKIKKKQQTLLVFDL